MTACSVVTLHPFPEPATPCGAEATAMRGRFAVCAAHDRPITTDPEENL